MAILASFSTLSPGLWMRMFMAMLTTTVTALVIVSNRHLLSQLMQERDDARAVQASHTGSPLRLGGIAILAGLAAGLLVGNWDSMALPALLFASAVPVLLAGLWEDLGFGMPALRRLAAAFVSAALAVVLLGTWVTRADLPGLDRALALAPPGVVFTLLLAAGFCHATNLIDGLNGLAAVVVISAATGLAVLAHGAGQDDLALTAVMLGAAMVGFSLLNYPFGKIFLGDAGSYGVGHMLIWIAILLADRDAGVAMPALLLLVFWPFADTLHSVARRRVAGASVFAPDRMHLHQKMRRCIEIVWLGGQHRKRSNPLATLVLAPMIMAPVVTGVIFGDNVRAAWIAVGVFATLFSLSHVAITRLSIRYRCRAKDAGGAHTTRYRAG